MRIACLTASLSRKAGGIYESVRRLSQELGAQPHTEVHVLGVSDEYTGDDLEGWAPLATHIFPVQGPRQFGYAPRLKERLFELDVDILLTHGLWMYPTMAALAWHRRTRRPFVINPHGMLDPWALAHSPWKKRLAGLFHENSGLQKAACLRALCHPEADSIRTHGLTNPVCIIPNGVDLIHEKASISPAWEGKVDLERQVLLYLGRIHPKKGLRSLLEAWAIQQKRKSGRSLRDWDLVIAGWSQNGHEEELKELARRLGISQSVHFPGPLFGPAKAAAYGRAHAFVLPSLSEGLPMGVLEAWAHGLPVIMTAECHLPEGFSRGAAICTLPETGSLVQALETLVAMNETTRTQMGREGRQLAADRFNWSTIGKQMHEVCRWLLEESTPPEYSTINRTTIPRHEPSLV